VNWLTWRTYLGFGAALAVAYYAVPSVAAEFAIWPAIGLSSAAAIVLGARRFRPNVLLAWYLFAWAKFAFISGDTLYNVRWEVLHQQSFPSVVDLFYLTVAPSLILGLALLIHRRSPGRDVAGFLDAAIITVGVGLLSWVFLISPYIRAEGLSPGERLVAVAYPVADLLILAVATRGAVSGGNRSPAWWLLAASIVPLLVADSLFGLFQIQGVWKVGGPTDIGWILFYVCWGAAALHPSMVQLSEPAAPALARLSRSRQLLFAGIALVGPVVLITMRSLGEPVDAVLIAGGSAVLFLLALARMSGLSGELAIQHRGKHMMESVLQVNEDERRRLASELHDGPVQRLELTVNRLTHEGRHLEAAAVKQEVDHLREFIAEMDASTPMLTALGLVGVLRKQAAEFAVTNGIACDVAVDPDVEGALAPNVKIALYRVANEALANIVKHADASHVWVEVATASGVVRLRVRDDGVGFDPAAPSASVLEQHVHYGLADMRRRMEILGGRLFVVSRPGQGTTITAELNQQLTDRAGAASPRL
jgi:signal transduction histidine kinase